MHRRHWQLYNRSVHSSRGWCVPKMWLIFVQVTTNKGEWHFLGVEVQLCRNWLHLITAAGHWFQHGVQMATGDHVQWWSACPAALPTSLLDHRYSEISAQSHNIPLHSHMAQYNTVGLVIVNMSRVRLSNDALGTAPPSLRSITWYWTKDGDALRQRINRSAGATQAWSPRFCGLYH